MSKNKKAIIYVRVGSSYISNKNLSITNQKKKCLDYANKNNYEIVEIISDYGQSSNKAFPKLVKKLLTDKRKIDLLVGYQFDRFSRNLEQFFSLNKLLQDKGIDIAIASSDTVLTPPGIEPRLPGNLIRNMLLSIAQYENEMKAERVTESMKAKFEKGYWLWQCPFGYKKSKKGGPLSVDTKQAEVVKNIFREASNQDSIDLDLISQKHSLPKNTIRKILTNPFYKGEMFSKKWNLAAQGRHKPLVDSKTWERAQI